MTMDPAYHFPRYFQGCPKMTVREENGLLEFVIEEEFNRDKKEMALFAFCLEDVIHGRSVRLSVPYCEALQRIKDEYRAYISCGLGGIK